MTTFSWNLFFCLHPTFHEKNCDWTNWWKENLTGKMCFLNSYIFHVSKENIQMIFCLWILEFRVWNQFLYCFISFGMSCVDHPLKYACGYVNWIKLLKIKPAQNSWNSLMKKITLANAGKFGLVIYIACKKDVIQIRGEWI